MSATSSTPAAPAAAAARIPGAASGFWAKLKKPQKVVLGTLIVAVGAFFLTVVVAALALVGHVPGRAIFVFVLEFLAVGTGAALIFWRAPGVFRGWVERFTLILSLVLAWKVATVLVVGIVFPRFWMTPLVQALQLATVFLEVVFSTIVASFTDRDSVKRAAKYCAFALSCLMIAELPVIFFMRAANPSFEASDVGPTALRAVGLAQPDPTVCGGGTDLTSRLACADRPFIAAGAAFAAFERGLGRSRQECEFPNGTAHGWLEAALDRYAVLSRSDSPLAEDGLARVLINRVNTLQLLAEYAKCQGAVEEASGYNLEAAAVLEWVLSEVSGETPAEHFASTNGDPPPRSMRGKLAASCEARAMFGGALLRIGNTGEARRELSAAIGMCHPGVTRTWVEAELSKL